MLADNGDSLGIAPGKNWYPEISAILGPRVLPRVRDQF